MRAFFVCVIPCAILFIDPVLFITYPKCLILRTNHPSQHKKKAMKNKAKKKPITGNRCGHDKDKPQLDLRFPASAKAPILVKTMVREASSLFKKLGKLKGLWKSYKSSRLMRSERREAVAQVIAACCKFCDVATGALGVREHGTFKRASLRRLWGHTSLSWPRFKRAFKNLVSEGYIKSIRQSHINEYGDIRATESFKFFTKRFWQEFGFKQFFLDQRDKAKTRAAIRQNESIVAESIAKSEQLADPFGVNTLPKRMTKPHLSDKATQSRRDALLAQADILEARYSTQ